MTDTDLAQILAYARAATRAPTVVVQLPDHPPALDWIADGLAKNMQTTVWGVALDTPTIEDEAVMVAITGNGPTSQANAEFYQVCHRTVPDLVAECQRHQAIVTAWEQVAIAARQARAHWNEFSGFEGFDEVMWHLSTALDRLSFVAEKEPTP